jgi:6-phosphogluconate dehydrogenase (decarboxylating)
VGKTAMNMAGRLSGHRHRTLALDFDELEFARGPGRVAQGHSIEMIHGGIEYGLMWAWAQGLGCVSKPKCGLARIARAYGAGAAGLERMRC